MVEAAADDGGGLRHLLDRLQPVEPRHQRVVQRGRDRQRAQGAVQVIGVRRLAQRARFEDRLGHLLDEQRHAVGPRGDLVEQRLGQALAAGDARDDRLRRRAREPVQREPGDDRMAGEGCDEGRARGDQQPEHAMPCTRSSASSISSSVVGSIQCASSTTHSTGLPPASPDELVDQGGKRAAAALLRRQG